MTSETPCPQTQFFTAEFLLLIKSRHCSHTLTLSHTYIQPVCSKGKKKKEKKKTLHQTIKGLSVEAKLMHIYHFFNLN